MTSLRTERFTPTSRPNLRRVGMMRASETDSYLASQPFEVCISKLSEAFETYIDDKSIITLQCIDQGK